MVPSRSITKAVATRFRPPPGVWSRSQRAKVVRARSQTVWWIAIPDFAWGSGKYSASGSRKVRSTFTAITHLLQCQRRGAAWAGRVRRGVASGAAAEPDSPHLLYRPNEEEISRGWSGGLRRRCGTYLAELVGYAALLGTVARQVQVRRHRQP